MDGCAQMNRVGNVESCLLEGDILYYRLAGESHGSMAITDATQILRRQLLGDARDIRVIVDCTGVLTADAETRRFRPYPHVHQLAFVADTAVSRWIVKAYLTVARLPYPTRVFRRLEDAVDWMSSP